jgi:3-deoxy-7-phosphoheptulonate synthase
MSSLTVEADTALRGMSTNANRRSIVRVGTVEIGTGQPVIIAGPCSVESYEQTLDTAEAVKSAGAVILRGGAYKPRTSPYDFQGLGVEGLQIMARVREETGLPIVSEILSTDDIEVVAEHVDMLQVGARNMQNFALLRRLGQLRKPILLKRNPAATVKEWLLAAEYLLAGGNSQVVLCERGIRSYDPELRNTLDLAGMALARQLSHLPVIADPSHATGRRDLIPAMSRAALAAGADGLIIEVHPDPDNALSDGNQSLDFPGFRCMMDMLFGARHA